MNAELIARVVNLIQRTGDRVVLADPQTGKSVVVLDLESYERLLSGQMQPAAVAQDTVPAAAPATPVPAPKIAVTESQKTAERSENPFKKRKASLGIETAPQKAALADLTQQELLDRINRDIGEWKTAQERKRADELKSAVQQMPRFEQVSALEEEERFYLEPIE